MSTLAALVKNKTFLNSDNNGRVSCVSFAKNCLKLAKIPLFIDSLTKFIRCFYQQNLASPYLIWVTATKVFKAIPIDPLHY